MTGNKHLVCESYWRNHHQQLGRWDKFWRNTAALQRAFACVFSPGACLQTPKSWMLGGRTERTEQQPRTEALLRRGAVGLWPPHGFSSALTGHHHLLGHNCMLWFLLSLLTSWPQPSKTSQRLTSQSVKTTCCVRSFLVFLLIFKTYLHSRIHPPELHQLFQWRSNII